MRRIQSIELHEQAWFPSSIRNEITDILQFGLNLSNAYGSAATLLQPALRAAGTHSVVDLCSGGGGPWLNLSREIHGINEAFRVCLTDKYPNLKAFQKAKGMSGNITFFQESVDATDVPRRLNGFRTMFTAFHHFGRAEARAILQSAVDARQGIGVFEITRRTPSAIGLMLLWSLASLALTPFIRPFRWSLLLWTYVIPIIPFVLLFDGVVSCLRTYRPQELNELTKQLIGADYEWETGEHTGAPLGVPITYLIGYPRACR